MAYVRYGLIIRTGGMKEAHAVSYGGEFRACDADNEIEVKWRGK